MNKAFTLLEIMIVAVILAIVAVAILSQTLFQANKGRDAKKVGNMANIKRAMEDKAGDDSCYPTSLPACGSDAWLPYLKEFPCESSSDYYYYTDPSTPSCPSWYMIFTTLEFEGNAVSGEVGCENGCSPPGTTSYQYDYFISSPNAPLPASP